MLAAVRITTREGELSMCPETGILAARGASGGRPTGRSVRADKFALHEAA